MMDDIFLPVNPEQWADAIRFVGGVEKNVELAAAMLAEGREIWPDKEGQIWSSFRWRAWGSWGSS